MEIKCYGVVIAWFKYDALGRRILKWENGQTIYYLYDGDNAVQERHYAGGMWTTLPVLSGLGIDQRYARTDTAGQTYFLTDHLGSTRALTDANGNIVQRYDYTPYGQTTASSTAFSNPYQYTGRELDQSGLYYYRARYYSPRMGRFISEDSIGLAGGINAYAYVGGNPVSYLDALGLDREIIFWSPIWRSPGSWFGHVSSRGPNGGNYSFGPGGWDTRYPTADAYIDRQTSKDDSAPNRSGEGYMIRLTPDQDKSFDQCMADKKAENLPYNAFTNNCTTAVRQCLNSVGFGISGSEITPGGLNLNLLISNSVNNINLYIKK